MENEVGPLSQIFTFSVNENLYKREMLKKKKKKRLKTFKHAQCIFHSEHADSVYQFAKSHRFSFTTVDKKTNSTSF